MTFDGHSKWVSEPIAMTDASKFKVRFNSSWDDVNTRGAEAEGFAFTAGTAFKVVSPGKDIAAPAAGTYTVTFDTAAEEVTVAAEGGMSAFTISSADDWAKFVVASAEKTYGKEETVTLASDITVTALVDTLFCNFDGGNHTITYSFDQASDGTENSLGLFRVVKGTQVKNLNVVGTLNTLAAINIGGVVGHAKDGAVIDHCVSNVTIVATKKVTQKMGGIVGWADAGTKITNCRNTGSVEMIIPSKGAANASQLGGIVGHIEGISEVVSCINDGKVTYEGKGTPRVGGICGYINNLVDVTFRNCTNNGALVWNEGNYTSSSWSYVGGITGYFGTPSIKGELFAYGGEPATVTGKVLYDGCTNNGSITCDITDTKTRSRIGGIASHGGRSTVPDPTDPDKTITCEDGILVWTLTNCTNNGEIKTTSTTANNLIGGVFGYAEASCKIVSSGCVNNGKISVAGKGKIGGLLGSKSSISSSWTNFKIGKSTELSVGDGGIAKLLFGANAAFTTPLTGKVQGGIVIVNGTTTDINADNFKDHLLGAALGEGGSADGVTFGE